MPLIFRWFIGRTKGDNICTLQTNTINNQSVVLVSASEGDEAISSASPRRFIGNAHIRVENIAPSDGKVVFRIVVDWDEPLPIWADIFVADGFPQGFVRSDPQ